MLGASISLLLIEEKRKQDLLDMFIPYLEELAGKSNGALVLAMNEEFGLLDSYWQDKNRFPYFITNGDNEIVGFALINDYCEKQTLLPRFSVAEFYIKSSHRKQGIGNAAAGLVFCNHRGHWEIRVQDFNKEGLQFWKNCAAMFAGVTVLKSQLTNKLHEGTFILFES